jgi:hypothetical protein
MFVRFRQAKHRLQVSLIETRRVDGKVCHEHIAGLGAIETPEPSTEARLAFWQQLHERLAKLANRVDAAMQGKVLGDIHARVPMVTLDEQRALQLENTEADEWFWSGLRDMHQGQADGHVQLVRTAEGAIAESQAAAAGAATKAADAKDRVERLKRGEDVPGGIGKRLTYEDATRIFHEAGLSDDDIAHAQLLAQLSESELKNELFPAMSKARDRAERALTRALVRRKRRA